MASTNEPRRVAPSERRPGRSRPEGRGDPVLTLAAWAFLAIGLAFLAAGLRSGSHTRAFIARAEVATGTVIADRGTPVIRFRTAEGAEWTFRGGVTSDPPAFDAGEQVEILYDPAHPADARLRTFAQLWFDAAILSGLGAIFALIGGGILGARMLRARSREALRRDGPRPRPRRRDRDGDLVIVGVMLLFLAGGLLFLSIGVLDLRRNQVLVEGRERATGTVIAKERGWPVVRFRAADGVERTFVDTRNEDFSPSLGEAVPVLYAPADPRVACVRTFGDLWGLGIAFAGMGGAFAAVGAGVLLALAVRSLSRASLRRRGLRVRGRLVRVEQDATLEVNGKHPWRIVCTWRDPRTGREHVLRSDRIWADPRPSLRGRTELTWFVDPSDPRRHAVDLEFLEPSA
jgi:hypothetical protein